MRQSPPIPESIAATQGVLSAGIVMLQLVENLLPELAREVEAQNQAITGHFRTLTQSPQEARQALDGILIALQYQDRHAQVIQDILRMVCCYRTMLEGIADVSCDLPTEAEAHRRLLASLVLSDLRRRYAHPQTLSEEKTHDAIELF